MSKSWLVVVAALLAPAVAHADDAPPVERAPETDADSDGVGPAHSPMSMSLTATPPASITLAPGVARTASNGAVPTFGLAGSW